MLNNQLSFSRTNKKRWVYPINPQTAYSEYMKGTGQGWPGMPNFGLDMKVMKDNELYKEITVF